MGTNEIRRKLHLAFVLAIVTLIATPKSTSAFLWLSPDQWRHVRPINEVAQSSEFNSNGWVLFGITSTHYIPRCNFFLARFNICKRLYGLGLLWPLGSLIKILEPISVTLLPIYLSRELGQFIKSYF